MPAEIVVIGTELLLGQIIDTNAAYLAQQLSSIGVDLYYKSTVGDNKGRIVEVLKLATGRSEIVITTGGIGPTLDDMTRESVADVVEGPLQLQPHLLEQIKHMMGSRYTENNARQAHIPTGSVAIENPVGTAPGFIAPTPPRWRGRQPAWGTQRVTASDRTHSHSLSQGTLQDLGSDCVAHAEMHGVDRKLYR